MIFSVQAHPPNGGCLHTWEIKAMERIYKKKGKVGTNFNCLSNGGWGAKQIVIFHLIRPRLVYTEIVMPLGQHLLG